MWRKSSASSPVSHSSTDPPSLLHLSPQSSSPPSIILSSLTPPLSPQSSSPPSLPLSPINLPLPLQSSSNPSVFLFSFSSPVLPAVFFSVSHSRNPATDRVKTDQSTMDRISNAATLISRLPINLGFTTNQ